MAKRKKKEDAETDVAPFEPASLVELVERIFVAPPREPYSNIVRHGRGLVIYAFGGIAATWNAHDMPRWAAHIIIAAEDHTNSCWREMVKRTRGKETLDEVLRGMDAQC